jgi:hypothetical protein
MSSTRSIAGQAVGQLMRKLLGPAVTLIAGGVLLSPAAFASMSYSETFTVEGLSGSANQTFTTSPFAPFDQAGTLVGIGIAVSGNVTLEDALVGEELKITVPGTGISNQYVHESETAGLWDVPVSASGIDTSPSDLSFYGGFTSPIEIEVQLIDANSSDQIGSPSSISGTWTFYYTPEPGSMLPVAMGLTGLALAGLRMRRMRGR